MGARTSLFVHKNLLITISFIITMILLVSTAYAANTTLIDIETNDEEASSSETTQTDVDIDIENEGSSSSAPQLDEQPVTEEEFSDSRTIQPVAPRAPIAPIPTGGSADASSESNEQSEPQVVEEGERIIREGTEDSNDSDVRIRIRNESDSELNNDDIDGASNEFRLEIKESASAD